MHIDFKITTWERIKVYDDDDYNKDTIIQRIKNGQITNSDSLYEITHSLDYEKLDESEEFLTPEENDGHSTIEIFDDDNKLIWSNEIK